MFRKFYKKKYIKNKKSIMLIVVKNCWTMLGYNNLFSKILI